MSASELLRLQYHIEATLTLWAPIIDEEREVIRNQPTLTEEEWKEFRSSHAAE